MSAQHQDRASQSGAADGATPPADPRLLDWQAQARQRRGDTLARLKARLLAPVGGGGLTAAALQQALARELGSGLIHDLLQDCAEWRGEKPGPMDPEQSAVIETALGEHLADLVPSDAGTGTADSGARLYRWLIPSLGGGLFGLFLLGPDGIGGTLGALVGAAGSVAGVAWLANHPDVPGRPIQATVGDGEHATARTTAPGLAWLRGPGHWLLRKAQGLARQLATRLVALVLPPPPVMNVTVPQSAIAPACERAFDLLTTLVFVRCTARADRAALAGRDDLELPITEDSVLRALLALVRALDRPPQMPSETSMVALDTVRDLAEELHQRLEDAGYVWEVLPDGTPFHEDHDRRFHTFGLVAPGDPVETLEPCFRRGEAILLPGRITKQRG